jgi:hypothetical protein
MPKWDTPMASYTLDNGAEIHREAPTTFFLPPATERENLRSGDLVKLIFRIVLDADPEVHVERMWVRVTEVLDNDPYCTREIRSGMRVEFHADHVIQIYEPRH